MPSKKRVTLNHARKHIIDRRPDGNPIDPSTVYRWYRKGLEGLDGERIKLAITYCGGRPMVTPEAIDAFFAAVTSAKLERHRRAESLAADVTADELEAAGLVVTDRDPNTAIVDTIQGSTDAGSGRSGNGGAHQ
ncbi:MAG: hypothetical protein P8J37_08985 [Fuerstiella sp.]|nr:hypothetical protein [Fuerstiella sp.]